MRQQQGLLLLLPLVCATTTPKYDPCRCNDYEKFENGIVWDRVNCCVPWLPRPVGPDLVKVDGIVYRRVVNASYYEQYSAFVAKQVVFPGEASVLYNPDNQYTNLSCWAFSCRSVAVYRNGSHHACSGQPYSTGECVEYDDARDWHSPLCHNNTGASKCVIWVPIRELTGGDWSKALLAVVSFAALLTLCMLVYTSIVRKTCLDFAMMLTWWLYTFILSEITVLALCRFKEWLELTEVALDYITFQTCIKECAQFGDMSVAFAKVNQCADRGVPCGGALSEGAVVSCRSCQSHRSAWFQMVVFSFFLWALLTYHWVVLFAYTLAIEHRANWRTAVVWALLLPPLGLFIASAVLTSRMALLGVHGLSTYFMSSGSVYDIGLAWTLCMCVWWPLFTLGKCLALGKRREDKKEAKMERTSDAASLVYCQ